MVAREQALDVLKKMRENRPAKLFNKVDESSAGMNFILVYLSEHDNDIYASTVADKMQISRARIAVLIQKLISKGLVEKSTSSTDARIEVIKLTEKGLVEINNLKEQMILNVTKVIEKIGIKEIYRFIDTSAKIKNILDSLE